jgi:hypothetical protein
MTNYVKSTSFASKDALATGNPLKIVKGAEIDTEFNNIAIASATKADTLSPVFTGLPIAPTASYGTNTTQLATTAFVTAALQLIYPVGSIYTNASVATNPSTLIGFGTWTAFGTGKVLIGIDGTDASFDTLGETGGSKDSVVVAHSHGTIVTDLGHVHPYRSTANPNGNSSPSGTDTTPGESTAVYTDNTQSAVTGIAVGVIGTGVSGTNTNLQPYVVVHMWQRTA